MRGIIASGYGNQPVNDAVCVASEWSECMRGWVRFAIVVAGLCNAVPASAESLRAVDARRFIAGKQFAYTCFEGTSGAGRIYADGSVVGYIKVAGNNTPRFVAMPAGTLRITGDQYCAHVRGLPFTPCFNVSRTSGVSWRGSISGMGFAFCDFTRRSTRADLMRPPPLRLRPTVANAN